MANAGGVPLSNNNTGFTPGASSISLRGFDPSATLVLIDGRRAAISPQDGGGTFSFIDLNTIPRAAIRNYRNSERQSSTTYGADAVAGVVNIKLYAKTIELQKLRPNTIIPWIKDSGLFDACLLFGIGDDKTQVSRGAGFTIATRSSVGTVVTPNKPPFQSSNASPENLELSDAVVIAAGGTPASPGKPSNAHHAPAGSIGNACFPPYVYTSGRSSTFNFGALQGMFPSSERYGGYINFDHKVLGDQLVIYGDMLYQNSKTHNELAPSATGSFQTKGAQTIAIPPNHPLPGGVTPPNTPTFTETGLPVDAFNPFNPFEQIISGGSRARLAEFGNRKIDSEADHDYDYSRSPKGDKLFDGTRGCDGGFRYSQVRDTENGTFVSVKRFSRILNAADPIYDPTSPEYIGTTVPLTAVGDFRVPIPANAASVAFAHSHPRYRPVSKLATLDLNIYTTQLFELPAGGVGLAFGGQFRSIEKYSAESR